jgi:hypothetical protein
MAGSVTSLHNGTPDGGDGIPPLEVYKVAVEEYRFQAEFNWSRTQYMLVFNAGILAAASAVGSRPGHGAALVFGLGAVAACLSLFVVRTQHDYYRAARDRMRRIEVAVGVPVDQRIDTTATLGGRRRRVSVNQLVYVLLGAVALGDLVGVGLIASR